MPGGMLTPTACVGISAEACRICEMIEDVRKCGQTQKEGSIGAMSKTRSRGEIEFQNRSPFQPDF